ncbi:MAG: hypothetical protein IPK92_14830 [Nitrospira sp.]|nr:hypothetical protein [Nitrospira sp.]
MNHWSYLFYALLPLVVSVANISEVRAQAPSEHQNISTETSVTTDDHHDHGSGRWEGSPEGIAYSGLTITSPVSATCYLGLQS